MDDGGTWGQPERGVFTDRTQDEIVFIDAVGDRAWWLVVVPAVCWFIQFESHLWIVLRVLYFFLWFGYVGFSHAWKERR